MRIFIAIPFSNETKTKIAVLQKTIRHGYLTAYDNLHLTVAFIGECDYIGIEILKEIVNKVETEAFTLEFDHLDSFKSSVLFLGSVENEKLKTLHKKLTSLLEKENFPIDKREFKGHVTLARKAKTEKTILEKSIITKVDRLEIMESRRVHDKLTYIPLYTRLL